MTESATTTADEPDGAPRIASLDILRGIAILGILFMNINEMGASRNASFRDIRHIGWTTADQVAWWLRAVFADGTARCLLEMLFGVGMVILTDRAAAAIGQAEPRHWSAHARDALFGPWPVMRGYYWRNLVLFAFGLVHVFILLWPGDILHSYGLAALIAFLFRRLEPKMLLALGLSGALFQLGAGGYDYLTAAPERAEAARLEAARAHGGVLTPAQTEQVEALQDLRKRRVERDADIAREVAAEDTARIGTLHTWAGAQWRAILGFGDELLVLWEAASVMLTGAALFKWGVIQGRRSRRFYLIQLLAGYAIRLSSRPDGALAETQFNYTPSVMWAMYEAARIATTLGHIALIQLLLTTAAGTRLLRPFEAAGRTALSIYIGQTLICLWLLYPPFALGLYGKQGWMALMLTALAIDAVLLLAANGYVRHYRIGPVEWAWRSLIAWRRLPVRKASVSRPA